jgi:hypothetical protein
MRMHSYELVLRQKLVTVPLGGRGEDRKMGKLQS